jgi:hypothetical protein
MDFTIDNREPHLKAGVGERTLRRVTAHNDPRNVTGTVG